MAKLPMSYDKMYHQSPDITPTHSDEEETPAPKVTQTVTHPYMLGNVRMRKKQIAEVNGGDKQFQMQSLRIELENAKTELNRRTVLFSNHYNDMVGKWQSEKTKREVAETVAVEKARDNMVLQRTHQSLAKRAKQSTETISECEKSDEEEKRDTIIETEDVVNLTEENEKQNLELQDLKETVAMLENQICTYKQENDEQSLDLEEMREKMLEMENELKQAKSYMQSAQHQYKNLAGRLQDEKGKREIAENVAVNKARELEVQKRTSVMVMSSLSQSFCPDISPQASLETMDYATRISSLEAEIEDLKESKTELENIVTKFELECNEKDLEIKQLQESLLQGDYTMSPLEDDPHLTRSVAVNRPSFYESSEMSLLTTDTLPQLLHSGSSGIGAGSGSYRTSNLVKGGTLDRPQRKKVSGMQSKEQLRQELKSKEAMINIMKLKLESMKIDGSKEDPELEVERKELEDQVGGLDRKLSSMNSDEKKSETEVDELREKLESVEKKAADFEEKTRYYQELLNKMNTSSDHTASARVSPTPVSASPVNIPAPPPNLPPPPPPPLPEGLFGPATPHLVIAPVSKRSQHPKNSDSRGEAMDELMSMLSSGKVHLKKAKNKVTVKREEPPPLILPRNILRRQVTVPNADKEKLLASGEEPSFMSLKPAPSETIDERLRQNRKQRESSEQDRSSELLRKLTQRLKTSESIPDQPDTVPLPKIDSNPPPPLVNINKNTNNSSKQPTAAKRKTTPVPLSQSPVLSHKTETIESIPEEREVEQATPPPLPEKKLKKQLSTPQDFPIKTSLVSPLVKQISCDAPKSQEPPPVRSKPPSKGPMLPPNTREFIPIAAKPKDQVKRQKSGSSPVAIPKKPSNLKSLFKKDGKANSLENVSPQRLARAATEGEIAENKAAKFSDS